MSSEKREKLYVLRGIRSNWLYLGDFVDAKKVARAVGDEERLLFRIDNNYLRFTRPLGEK